MGLELLRGLIGAVGLEEVAAEGCEDADVELADGATVAPRYGKDIAAEGAGNRDAGRYVPQCRAKKLAPFPRDDKRRGIIAGDGVEVELIARDVLVDWSTRCPRTSASVT